MPDGQARELVPGRGGGATACSCRAGVCFIGDDHEIPPAGESLFFAGRRPSTCGSRGDNLIGNGTIVLGNVTIGRGAVVGAGSLVLADVPSHAIVLGRPARLVRYRLGGGPGESAPPAPGAAAATRAG